MRIMKKINKIIFALSIIWLVFVIFGATAFSGVVPNNSDFLYDIYDIFVNKIIKGPLGFVIGVGFIAMSIILFVRQLVIWGIVSLACVFIIFQIKEI